MFGCLRRLGCLAILLVGGVLLYFNREAWLPRARELTGLRGDEPAAVAEGTWQPLTPEGAERARARVRSLSAPRGPVYTNIAAADLAAYVFDELRARLPSAADGGEAAVFGDQLHVRTVVRLADLGGTQVLGPLAQFLAERDTVQFGGTFEVLRPGVAQFRVRQIKLRQLSVPSRLVPELLRRLNDGARPEGVAADGLALTIPPYVGDVRVAQGRVTLYKTTQ